MSPFSQDLQWAALRAIRMFLNTWQKALEHEKEKELLMNRQRVIENADPVEHFRSK